MAVVAERSVNEDARRNRLLPGRLLLALGVSMVLLVGAVACSDGDGDGSQAGSPAASGSGGSGGASGEAGKTTTTKAIAGSCIRKPAPGAKDVPEDKSGDPVFTPTGDIDADVVVQAFDPYRYDKPEYTGKADLTIGLYGQGAGPHTIRIDGIPEFGMRVDGKDCAALQDFKIKRGRWTMFCELPGHRDGGMQATLVIP